MTARYHANYRAVENRRSSFNDSFSFIAADDAAAETIAGIVDTITNGKRVSLTGNLQDGHPAGAYADGTRYTITAQAADAVGGLWKFRLRNAKDNTSWDDIVSLLTGAVGTGDNPVTALGAPPQIPASGLVVDTVRSVTIVDKS